MATDAPETQTELPPLADAWKTAMADQGDTIVGAPPEKPAEKAPEKPVEKAPEKPAEKATEKPADKPADVVPEKTAKKKSALDAALSDEPAADKPVVDEVSALIESKYPNWDKARATLREQSTKLKEYEAKLSKANEPPPEVLSKLKTIEAEATKLKEENAKLRDAIVAVDIRLEPEFQAKYVEGRERQVASLATRIEQAGGSKDAFLAAMDLPLSKRGKAIDAALENIESGRDKAAIEAKLGQVEILDEERDEQLSRPQESFDRIKQDRERQQKDHADKVAAFKEALFEKTRAELPKLSKFMRKSSEDAEGAAEFNERLAKDIERAPSLLDVSPEEAVVLAHKASRYDSLEQIALERFAKDAAKIEELEGELAKYHGSEPGFRGNGKPKPKADYEVPIEQAWQNALDAAKATI